MYSGCDTVTISDVDAWLRTPLRNVMKELPRTPILPVTASVRDFLNALRETGTDSAVIVDEKGRIVGIVTDFDLLKLLPLEISSHIIPKWHKAVPKQELEELSVADIMSRNPLTIDADKTLREAIEVMLKFHIAHIIVVDKGQPIGVLSKRYMLRKMFGAVES